jgi:translation initiation factor eIF-2B subunit gamma
VIGAGSSLRECLVGAEYEVEEGDDVRAETLSSKAR